MTRALLMGALVLVGAPWQFVVLLAAGLAQPVLGLAMIYILTLGRRGNEDAGTGDARFCGLVADELRAGASLRSALEVAAQDLGDVRLGRLCRIGRPYAEIAERTTRLLPVVGTAAASAVELAGRVGGRVAASFEALAQMAADEDEMRRERRSATAQIRASALLIASLPPLLLAGLIVTGDTGVLLAAGTTGLWMMAAGGVLIATGLGVIWGIMRSAEPSR